MITELFNFWDLFVENIFGGFWLSIIGLSVIFIIILMVIGRVSAVSAIVFVMIFILAMVLGYGYITVTILITFVILIWFFFQVISKLYNG